MVFSFCSGVNRTVGEAHSYGWRIHVRRLMAGPYHKRGHRCGYPLRYRGPGCRCQRWSGRALLGHLRLWSFPKNSAVYLAAAAWWEEASESAD
jgi:hypothetical protein